ncbi:hypothetical protein BCY91_10255 [Pelobium manganitolerans]|uniref:Outer membrane protein beta-barrel domain-containing protein n=1 Tax=Pelobium manganitolerans TaxID=1842495 RepID=A0A419S2K5_9SPHI|nr:hypothetical protein [Pelobium manganitolerans]RKD13197.1 hypothetical protein BCY91_10255 [Pelobium manganitolerans]
MRKPILLVALALSINAKASTFNINKISAQNITVLKDSVPENAIGAKPSVIPLKKFRLAFSGGPSFLMSKTNNNVPEDFRQYVKELKSGSHFSVDGGYFWREDIGLGLKYSSFYSKNSMANVYVEDAYGQQRYGSMADNINTQFVGAVFYNRAQSKSAKITWLANIALGYISYKDEGRLVDPIKITGSNIGASLDFGADFKLSNSLYLGLQAGYMLGVLKKLKYTTSAGQQTLKLDKDNYESMNRIDLSGGIRWVW